MFDWVFSGFSSVIQLAESMNVVTLAIQKGGNVGVCVALNV